MHQPDQRPRVLVLSDSHGTDYAGRSYVDFLSELLAAQPRPVAVVRHSFSGIPLAQWVGRLPDLLRGPYQAVIVQYGNADVHPRIPQRLRSGVRRTTGIGMRDTWFQVPPRLGVKYLVKLPFLVMKRVLIGVLGTESYTSAQDLEAFFLTIRNLLPDGTPLIVLPLVEVKPILYGKSHNRAAAAVNERLESHLGGSVLRLPGPPRYVADGFHWREAYHRLLAEALAGRLSADLDQRGTGAP